MNPLAPNRHFQGIIPPLVTPLTGRDQLDEPGLARLIEHVIRGGVSGIFILGTTGEAPSLSYRLRGELIQQVCALTAGRVPVLVGITDTAFVESMAVISRQFAYMDSSLRVFAMYMEDGHHEHFGDIG